MSIDLSRLLAQAFFDDEVQNAAEATDRAKSTNNTLTSVCGRSKSSRQAILPRPRCGIGLHTTERRTVPARDARGLAGNRDDAPARSPHARARLRQYS